MKKIIFILVICLFFGGCKDSENSTKNGQTPDLQKQEITQNANSQQSNSQVKSDENLTKISENEALNLDSDIKTGSLENGLKYYILANDNPKNSAYFYLDINAGSIDENDDEQGLAHFVEHMAFNGSEHFSKNELIRKLESLGVKFGADLNAMTSFENTTYNVQISVNDENLKSVFLVLKDWAGGLKFDEDEIKKESGVILEEAKRDVGTRLYEKRAEYIYPSSIYAKRFPIGKNEIIANADCATLLGFYKRMYQPRFMSLVVVGDIDKAKIENLIKEYFSDLKNADEPIRADKTLIPFKGGFANLVEKESGANLINIMFADTYEPLNSQSALRKAYLKRYISTLLSVSYDKLNITLKSPIKGNFSSGDLFRQRVLNSFSANIIDKDTNATLSSLFSAIKGVREFGFSKDDFESVKKEFLKQNLSEFQRSDTQVQGVYGILNFIYEDTIKLSKKDKFELGENLLNSITLKEINEHFKTITNGDKFVEFITPEPLKITQSEIDKIYENATPYDFSKDLATNGVLLSEIPAKIAPSKDEFDKENEIYILEFENGARAILKDIKTIKNQINFLAVKKGGKTNFPSKQQAGVAIAVLNSGTIGDFGKYESAKLTSGFTYSLKAGINDMQTTFSGNSSSDNFENLLQEFFIKFNNPKLHESEFELYKQRAKTDIAKRNETSGYRFSKEILENFYGGNERAMPLEISDLDGANLSDLQKIVDESFKNAGEFLFVISGDLDIAKTKDLLGIYVANLKGEKTQSIAKDDGLRAKKGVFGIEKDYGDSDKSEVSVIIQNDEITEFSVENVRKFNILKDVIRAEILEKIREEKGQIYSASVSGEFDNEPYQNAHLNINFSCKKDDAKLVVSELREILDSIKKDGVKESVLENAKKAKILSIKRNAQNAPFWIANLSGYGLWGFPIYNETEYEKSINSITNDDIKAILSLVDTGNFFTAILNPKN